MKDNIVHFLYVPFTGLGLHNGYRGDDWLKYRIKIFKEYVIPSLLNQTNKNFVLWISWRKEEENNPIVKELSSYLSDTPIKFVFTYDGIMFWDDKYPNDKLRERLEKTLPWVSRFCYKKDWVYLTIQPSDDMYYSKMVEDMQLFKPKYKMAIGYQEGYIINLHTKEMAEYNPDTNPPFYTIVFPQDIFLHPGKHYKYIGPYKSHEYIPEIFKYERINGRGFCVGCHGGNISTVFNHPFKGDKVEKDKLKLFGIEDSPPIEVRRSAHLLVRKILNKLPFNQLIRKIYHKIII